MRTRAPAADVWVIKNLPAWLFMRNYFFFFKYQSKVYVPVNSKVWREPRQADSWTLCNLPSSLVLYSSSHPLIAALHGLNNSAENHSATWFSADTVLWHLIMMRNSRVAKLPVHLVMWGLIRQKTKRLEQEMHFMIVLFDSWIWREIMSQNSVIQTRQGYSVPLLCQKPTGIKINRTTLSPSIS